MTRRQRRSFTPEFKAEAVRLVQEGSKSLPQVAKDLDLTESALRNWMREEDERKSPASALTAAEREELSRLRKEVRQLQMERDFLKNSSGSVPHCLLRKKLGASTLPLAGRSGRLLFGAAVEPVKKHGPGRVADLRVVMPSGQSRLGN